MSYLKMKKGQSYGFFELINILDDLQKQEPHRWNNVNISSSRFAWISNVFDEMIDESQEKAKDFLKFYKT